MAKKRSLSNQLIHALGQNRAYGESKRSYKKGHGNSTDAKIFGNEHYEDLQKEAKQIAEFVKKEHPDIKWAREITPDILQEYLQSKADAGVKQLTLQKKISYIRKLETCVSKTFGKTQWHTELLAVPEVSQKQSEKARTVSATDAEFEQILAELQKNAARKNGSNAWRALVLARHANLRSQEAACIKLGRFSPVGGKYGCGTLTVQGKEDGAKGGRWRVVDILTPAGRDAIKATVQDCGSGENIVQKSDGTPISPDGIDKAYYRVIKKLGFDMDKWRWNCGNHPFRKAYAQELWDACRSAGGSREDAGKLVNTELGHGENRKKLLDVYVKNQW